MKRGRAGTGNSRGSKLGRAMKAPLRALGSARDLYVRSMTGFADWASWRGVAGYPGAAVAIVPGNYRFHPPAAGSSSEDDLRELVRGRVSPLQGTVRGSRSPGGHAMGGEPAVAPRCQRVGMVKIEEDGPCDFGRDAMVVGPLCPKSRSCAVAKRMVGVIP